MSPMPVVGPRLNNFEARQTTGSSSSIISTLTSLTTTTVTVGGSTATETVTSATTEIVAATTTTTVYVTHVPPSQAPPGPQAITETISSTIIWTRTKLYTNLITPSASVSVVTTTDTVSSAILTTATASSRPPSPDHSSQRTITGLAVALVGAIIIACLAVLFWRKRKQGKDMRDSQSATPSSGLVSYTSEPHKSPIQKSMAYGVMGYFRNSKDGSSGVTHAPDSQTQSLNDNGNEEFFPRSLSQCTGIGLAL